MKVILVDDERLALEYLEHQLLSIYDFKIVGKYTNPFEGKEMIEQHDVDIVFLDIHIPEINGIELAEKLLEKKPHLHIVFVTAYDNFAIQAFELNALDYVLKPIKKERLQKTVARILDNVQAQTEETTHYSNYVQMNLLGPVTMIDEHEQVISIRWRTNKALQLFLYLLQNRKRVVSKAEIIELFWGDQELKKAYAQLYTAIYYIRKTLEPLEKHIQIKNMSDGYMLSLHQMVIDIDQFESFIQSKEQLNLQTVKKFEQVLSLYRGDYLEGYDFLWAENERQRLQLIWRQGAFELVNWYIYENDLNKALYYCMEICNRCPLEEDSYFYMMQIYAEIGNDSSVHKQYQRLEEVLNKEIGEKPSLKIINWYRNWKKNGAANS